MSNPDSFHFKKEAEIKPQRVGLVLGILEIQLQENKLVKPTELEALGAENLISIDQSSESEIAQWLNEYSKELKESVIQGTVKEFIDNHTLFWHVFSRAEEIQRVREATNASESQ